VDGFKLAAFAAIGLMLFSVTAAASMIIPASENAKERAMAPEKSPVIGDGWDLERVDFIHYAKQAKPGPKPGASCYKLLGVKWKSLPVSYVINPLNPDNLTQGFVTGAVSTAAEAWDAKTPANLISDSVEISSSAQYGVRDYKNSVVFGDYPDANAIAVTSIWFTRAGKQIVEFDIIFNTRFEWGDASANAGLMDLQNIATHEFGHAVGLDDIYSASCSQVTMYGYSGYGELIKRTLEQPDITGLQSMYGA